MEHLKNRIIAVVLGIVFAWAAVWITGIGAAVAVPTELLKPVAQISGLLAFTLVDFFTIAIPLVAAFLLLVLLSKLVVKKPDALFYLLLLAPFVLQQLYFLLQFQPPVLDVVLQTLPRWIVLAVCCYFVVRATQSAKA